MKSELIESPWWMRLTASPSRRATLMILIFFDCLVASVGAMVSVRNTSESGDSSMRWSAASIN